MSGFEWNPKRRRAARGLAAGKTQRAVAAEVGISRTTLGKWLKAPAFVDEVDRLSELHDVAGRAERLRIAKRLVKSRTRTDGVLQSDRDVLDWLKFVQSETRGVRLGLARLAEEYESDGRS